MNSPWCPPLLTRFTVRSLSLIEQAKLWQRGAMVRYPGAHARMWTTEEEKYLFATVAGPEGDRTALLSIIRIPRKLRGCREKESQKCTAKAVRFTELSVHLL